MKRHRNVNLLLMLVLLVAVGQMAQTIYIPAIADMARDLNVREGAVQSVMGAYLLTYGVSQLFYGPISDRVGRRPVILVGMSIFMLATLVAVTTSSLTVLIAASAMQGMGTGVGGVMARTLPGYDVELARLLSLFVGTLCRCDLQYGPLDAGNASGRRTAHAPAYQL